MKITDKDRKAARALGITTDEGIEKVRLTMETLDEIIQEEAVNAHKTIIDLGLEAGASTRAVCRQVDITNSRIQKDGELCILALALAKTLKDKDL